MFKLLVILFIVKLYDRNNILIRNSIKVKKYFPVYVFPSKTKKDSH